LTKSFVSVKVILQMATHAYSMMTENMPSVYCETFKCLQ